jgi:hypothetical protein
MPIFEFKFFCMKRVVGILFLICCCIAFGFSQSKKTIVLIPFNVSMFNNQESAPMLAVSDMTYDQSIQFFMTSLDEHLSLSVSDTINFYSLLRTYTTDAFNDIDIVHQQASYTYIENPSSIEEKKEASAINQLKRVRKKPNPVTKNPGGEIISVREDNSNKLMSARFPDPQLFIDLIANYSAQYVLFVTQFEILGDFSDPYAVAQRTYIRTIRVHYVIFNKKGDFVHGDIATQAFTAQENNIAEVCAAYMPAIAKRIARKLP